MTRSVKAHEYAEKRNAILDVAAHYIRLIQMGEVTADALERVLGMKPVRLWQSWSEDFSRWQALLA